MKRSPSLGIVYATVFLDLLGFGIILPLLPFYAERFGATGLWIGALLTAYSAAQFVGAPILGRLSDRAGRRPVLLASLLGSTLSLALTGAAASLPVLLAARLLAGLFGGSIGAAQAYIADVTRPEERARYMGLLGAAIGLGFTLGPGLGAALSGLGFGGAAFAAAGLAALNLVLALFFLPESRRVDAAESVPSRSLLALREALGQPMIGGILWSSFLLTFAFTGLEATYALLAQRQFGLDGRGLGLIFTYFGVIQIVVQGGLMGRLTDRFGEQALAVVGGVCSAIGLAVVPFGVPLPVALLALGALGVGQGLTTPTLTSLLSRASRAAHQGSTLGVGQSASAAARALGPILAGWLFDREASLPYLLGAALCVTAAALIYHRPSRSEEKTAGLVGGAVAD